MRSKAGFILFSLSLVTFTMVLGGNIYQIIAEVPNWNANIPESLVAYRKLYQVSHAGYFFQTFVPITILGLIAAIILLWNRPKAANRWMLFSLGGVLIAEIFTGIYFMPRNFILFLDPVQGIPVDQLKIAGNEWIMANYIRTGIVVLTLLFLLKAYRTLNTESSKQ